MWPEPGDPRTGRFEGIRQWWLALPWAMRINAALYALAGIAALVLLIDLTTSREDPRRVEVAQQATTTTPPPTTTALTAPPAPETPAPPPTTAAGDGASTTSTTALGRTSPTAAPRATPTPTGAPAVTTVAPPRDCRNSTNSACGNFAWDPLPEANQPVTVSVGASNPHPAVNENVTFQLVAADADHLLDDRCARIDFGDGVVGTGSAPCNPPNCPAAFGPWTPPPRQPGRFEGAVVHSYGAPGNYEVRVTFSNEQQSCTNPYSGTGSSTIQITVTG